VRTPSFIIFLSIVLLLAAGIGAVSYITFAPPSIHGGKASDASEALPPNIAPPTRPFISSTSPLRGDAAATVTIFEFGDFFCAPCADVDATLQKILDEYKGRVKLIWKDLPNTTIHPLAQKAAQAARCAAEQNKFWEYHDALLNQTGGAQTITEDTLSSTAQTLGLAMGDFTECLASERTKDLVSRDTNEAILLKVDATPYFFIGTERFSGAVSEARLKEIIDAIKK